MKYLIVLLVLVLGVLTSCKSNKSRATKGSVILTKLWETDTLLKTCEAVRYDNVSNHIYVSNMGNVPTDAKDGDGSISILNTKGDILNRNWTTNLHAPKGANFFNNKFYVADIDAVIKIDMKSGNVEKTIPVEDAIFLNDLDIDSNGDVYVTDSRASRIYKMVNDEVSLWLNLEGLNPNGIFVEKNRVLVVSFSKGDFIAIDKKTKAQTVIATGIVKGDGIVAIKQGYLISTWPGEVFFVHKKQPGSAAIKILDTQNEKLNAADIGIIPDEDILLIPTFFGNTVVAYKIDYEVN